MMLFPDMGFQFIAEMNKGYSMIFEMMVIEI